MKPSKACATPGCSERVGSGHCVHHQRQRDDTGDRFNVGLTSYDQQRYRRARRRFLAAHPVCVDCKADGFIEPATELDHIVPHRGNVELFWNSENWAARCKHHHAVKTARETLHERRGADITEKREAADRGPLENSHRQNPDSGGPSVG